MLTDEEMTKLVFSAVCFGGDDGATEEEVEQVCKWANQARTDADLLELTLNGKLLVGIKDGEVTFRARQ